MSDIERTLVAAMRESDHATSVSPHARERYLQLAGPGSRDAVPGLLRRRRTQVMLAAAVAVVAVIGTVVAPAGDSSSGTVDQRRRPRPRR